MRLIPNPGCRVRDHVTRQVVGPEGIVVPDDILPGRPDDAAWAFRLDTGDVRAFATTSVAHPADPAPEPADEPHPETEDR